MHALIKCLPDQILHGAAGLNHGDRRLPTPLDAVENIGPDLGSVGGELEKARLVSTKLAVERPGAGDRQVGAVRRHGAVRQAFLDEGVCQAVSGGVVPCKNQELVKDQEFIKN